MKKQFTLILMLCLTGFTSVISIDLHAQSAVSRDTIISAAREIITETTFCGLVTVDSTGQPQTRTMNPFPAGDDLIIWFATSRYSRKVKEIRNNPKVSVYFADHINAKGYVNISGTAEILDDKELLVKMKRGYWEGLPDWQNIFVLIKIKPVTLEVVNYKHGLNNDPVTSKAPSVSF
ncbi:MAG: pyridoxamine 5'-phosphate oxidase family protein [Lentimicrobium sp.]